MLILDSIAAEAKLCMQHKAGSCGAMADIFMEMAKYPDGFKDSPMSFYGRHPNIYLLGPGYCGNPEMEVGPNNTGKTLGSHKMYCRWRPYKGNTVHQREFIFKHLRGICFWKE